MEYNMLSLIVLIVTLLCFTECVIAAKLCEDCGHTLVPYPLSTGPNCGDQSYKVQCKADTLWFNALNGSSYVITYINPQIQRLILRPPGLAKNTCMAADLWSHGIQLDNNLPFNITSSNTVMLMNCSTEMLQFSMNCSSASICHNYIRGTAAVAAACGFSPVLCCWFQTGGSFSEYRIRIRQERCSAYESFVNLDTSLPVNEWPQPGLEIQWALPHEPVCKMPVDCRDLANSECLFNSASVGRCLCKVGFQWDPINGVCKSELHCYIGFLISNFLITHIIVIIFGGIIVNFVMEIFDHK